MTNLSPAAQAVLDAAGDSEPGFYATVAATLRAVAEHCYFIDDDGCEMVSVLQILAIAAELEDSNG